LEAGLLPCKARFRQFLNYYAGRLNTVEVNYTFRSLPTEKLLTGWMAETPPGFKFAIKANQTIITSSAYEAQTRQLLNLSIRCCH